MAHTNASVSIKFIKSWKDKKIQELKVNKLSVMIKEMIEKKQKGYNDEEDNLQKLMKFYDENITKITSFIELVLNLCEPTIPNYSKLIDLYLELLELKLKMIDNNDIAFEQFIGKNLFYTRKTWSMVEKIDNFQLPIYIEAHASGNTSKYVSNIESNDTQTVVIIKKSSLNISHLPLPFEFLTMECLNFHKEIL